MHLPPYAQPVRTLPIGLHAYLDVLPGALESPALDRILPDRAEVEDLVRSARVRIRRLPGAVAFIDPDVPCIVFGRGYLRTGSTSNLYLDLLHELTHLRHLRQGFELWDARFDYVDRPTEIEAYAVAVGEGLRLGMTEAEVLDHLSSWWLGDGQVARLRANIQGVLDGGAVPHWDEGLTEPKRRRRWG